MVGRQSSRTAFATWIELWTHYERDNCQFVDMSSGAPFAPAPDALKAQLLAGIAQDDYVRYHGPKGHPLSLAAVAAAANVSLSGRCDGRFGPANVCMTAGASAALSACLQYLSRFPRGGLVLGMNYYFAADACHRLGVPVGDLCSATTGRTLPTVAEVRARVAGDPPGFVILVLPNNPTGEMYTESELAELAAVLRDAGVWLLLDRIELDEARCAGAFVPVLRAIAGAGHLDRTLIVDGPAKTRSLVATRTGHVLGPPAVAEYVAEFNRDVMFGPPSAEARFLALDLFFRSLLLRERERGEVTADDVRHGADEWRAALTAGAAGYESCVRQVLPAAGELADVFAGYAAQLRARYATIARNRAQLRRLRVAVEAVEPIHGANSVITLPDVRRADQVAACKRVFDATRVALIPEACFRAGESGGRDGLAFVRITASTDPEVFDLGVDLLRHYYGV